MITSIEARELISLDYLGVPLRGTYHPSRHKGSSPDAEEKERNRIGVLFLSILLYPRTATGDSAVYWADAFAEQGYPSFRFDLPGLGDSSGEPPTPLIDFINAGGYLPVLSSMIKQLVEQFDLSGVVIVGHCAGAVSAVYSAANSKECMGLVLMDPYFHLPCAKKPGVREGLIIWSSRNRLGGHLRRIFLWLREIRLALHKDSPPGNANFALLGRWKRIASMGMPILIFKAFGTKPRLGEFDYLTYVQALAGLKGQIMVRLVEGTDHSFANRVGRATVRQQIGSWLESHFPMAGPKVKAQSATPQFRERDNRSDCVKLQTVSAHVGCTAEGKQF